MPIKKEREYRALAAPLTAGAATKRIQTDFYVEGYATTFDAPYLLYEFEDGTKIYERIDAHADSYNLRKKIKSLADAAIQKAA